MATKEQSDIYHEARNNGDWLNLTNKQKCALLEDASDWIHGRCKVRPILLPNEQRAFDNLVCLLADTMRTNPPVIAATVAIKKESSELAGMKTEVEYEQSVSDPYPYITAALAAFLVDETGSQAFVGTVA